jgi:ABC-2 type transport system permease protein
MKGWWPLFKKEVMEQIRTHRVIILAGVFLFFGLTSILTIKYLPEIIKMTGTPIPIEMPAPTSLQALTEFSQTVLQMGVLVLILVSMGSIANEFKNGTALLTLSKPVTRIAFITSKLAALSLNLVISLVVSGLICYGYSVWLIGPADFGSFAAQSGLLALFLIFCLSLTLLFSSLFRSSLAAGGLALVTVIGLAILSSFPKIGNYLPGKLPGWGTNLLNGSSQSYWWALGITIGLIAICLYLTELRLKNKEA